MSQDEGPPPHIPAARLFRLLLTKPRPSISISYRIKDAPGVELTVRGLRGVEEGGILDRVSSVEVESVRESRMVSEYVAASLYACQERVFMSADQVNMLSSDEAVELGAAVIEAMKAVSPTYPRSDVVKWSVRLREGAMTNFNIAEAELMASSQDYIIGKKAYPLPRPDRYFGMALSELTDGQLMAYRAGVKVIRDLRGESD